MTAPTPATPTGGAATTWHRALRLVSLNLSGRTFFAGYATLGIVTALAAVNYLILPFEGDPSNNVILSLGSALWAWPVLAAVLIGTRNYSRTLNLGASRKDFYLGSLLTVGALSLGVGLATTVLHYTLDAAVLPHVEGVAGISETMGHFDQVPALAWLATATAVLVMALMAQTIVLLQARWVARPAVLVTIDVAIIAVLFTILSIPWGFRALYWAFWWIMTGPDPFVQVPIGLAVAAGLALLGWALLRRRTY